VETEDVLLVLLDAVRHDIDSAIHLSLQVDRPSYGPNYYYVSC